MKLAVGVLLIAAVAASGIYFVRRQNAQRAQSVAAQNTMRERAQYEASLVGRCQPFHQPAAGTPLAVSLYFSLERDCLSCVQEQINQLNGLPLQVTGYTRVDGIQDERILTEQLKPAFPVVRVEQLETKLRSMGITETPVIFVTNPATGRILLTHAPLAAEKHDRSFVDRLRLLATPCEALTASSSALPAPR